MEPAYDYDEKSTEPSQKEDHLTWKKNLQAVYWNSLYNAGLQYVESIIFPPIGTGADSLNERKKVEITPIEAAELSLKAINQYFENKPKSPIKNIFLISKIEDKKVHLLAYKSRSRIGRRRVCQEELLLPLEKQYITELENKANLVLIKRHLEKYMKHITKRINLIIQHRATLPIGVLVTLVSLYVLKKYRY